MCLRLEEVEAPFLFCVPEAVGQQGDLGARGAGILGPDPLQEVLAARESSEEALGASLMEWVVCLP